MKTDKIDLARAFAYYHHNSIDHKRKYTEEPYTVHLEGVVKLLTYYCHPTEDMICAAYGHELREDVGVEINTISLVFGKEVAKLVEELTDYSVRVKSIENRAKRKAMDRDSLAKASAEAQTIKCCDLIDNTKSIVQHDKQFAKVYLKEKRALLDALTKAEEHIRIIAYEVLEDAENNLRMWEKGE